MVSKHFLTKAVLGLAILLMATDGLHAAGRGGGGGGRGGGGYGGGGGRGYGGGYYGGRGYGGFYGGGFYGGGLFYGDYITGGGYPGYFAPYAYPAYSPGYSYADPLAPSSSARISSYPPANSYYYPPLVLNQPSPATIHVVLPDPKATVQFDGRNTTSTGGERYYNTPDLTPGGSYQYNLRVTWMQDGQQVTQERTVAVTPGQTTDVVFTRSASDAGPAISAVK